MRRGALPALHAPSTQHDPTAPSFPQFWVRANAEILGNGDRVSSGKATESLKLVNKKFTAGYHGLVRVYGLKQGVI
jgi:hypothetical protein